MYLKQFGFQEKPFHITPNPKFIFLSKNHKDAFAHLLYGLQQRVGFMSLTGEVGTGKTTVLRTLLGQLADQEYSLALVLNPCLSALELMENIHREFSIPIPFEQPQNLGQLHESLNRFLLEQRGQGRTVVLVIDEAQNLEPSVLEQLRLLSNLETETDKLIQMVLVGQPELEELFERQDLRQLRQRLVIRYRLMPMDEEDSEAYIRHRLKVAGWKGGTLFNGKAVRCIFQLTGGTPRLINILCDRALLVAYSQETDRIDQRVIQTAQAELRQTDAPPMKQGGFQLSLALAVVCAILISLTLLWPRLSNDLERFSQPQPAQAPGIVAEEPLLPEIKALPALAVEPTGPVELDIEMLQETIAALGRTNATERAVVALLGASNLKATVPGVSVDAVLNNNGLQTFRFSGSLDGLLAFNTPALLEIQLPTEQGNYYFALLGTRDDAVLLDPPLSESGWLSRAELEQLWFGRALIPWTNSEEIPYLVEPGIAQPGVVKLQSLLRGLGFTALSLSGVFDLETIRAVTAIQRQNQLTPDGRVGPQTLLLIYRLAGYEIPELYRGGPS